MFPWIDVNSPFSAKLANGLTVNDPEFQTKLVSHLLLPLDLQRGWTHDEYCADPVTNDHLLYDKSRFDGFSQADVVGDE